MKKVAVTGANGHVGYSVTKLLIERGYDVRATVRDASDPAKTAHLKALGVEIAEADLMRPETLAPVMEGRDGLFQIAAVYLAARSRDFLRCQPAAIRNRVTSQL